jgi:hypothetical protein
VATTLKGLSLKLDKLPARVVADASARFVVLAEASAARAMHGSNVMSMHTSKGRQPAVLTVRVKAHDDGPSGARAFLYATPPGVWSWLESGTQPHLIGKGKVRGRGAKRKMTNTFLKGAAFEHPVRGPVLHPGTHGKQAWSRAVAEFRVQSHELAVKALKETLGG